MIGFGNFVNSVRINKINMNKQELKSLLENIYSTLAEQNPPPLPPGLAPGGGPVWAPRLLLPGSPTGPPPTPTPKPRLKPPVATPVPPKPKPRPTPNPELSSPRPRFDPTNPFDPRNPFRLPNPPKPPPLSPGQQQIRDALRELGFPESEIEQIIN